MQASVNFKVRSASGLFLYEKSYLKGKRYLDFSASTNNLVLGHNPPSITNAIVKHLKKNKPIHLSSRYDDPIQKKFKDKIGKILPKELNVINHKLSDGSSAVEDAINRALKYQQNKCKKRTKLVVFKSAHHGQTICSMAASPKHHKKNHWFKCLNKHFVCVPDFLNLKKMQHILKREDIAGVLLEPILVNAGVIISPVNYLKKLRKICDLLDKTLIFDEVQTGAGWLGTLTASEFYKVTPDIAVYAKGFGNGISFAFTSMKPEFDILEYDEMGFTHGGTPLTLSINIAIINSIKKHLKKVKQKGALLKTLLKKIDYNFKDIRGEGLIFGIEFFSKKESEKVYKKCIEYGLVLRKSGVGNTLIFKPPIIVTKKQIKEAVIILEKVLCDL